MSDEQKRILDLLAAGKVTADEANELLNALKSDQPANSHSSEEKIKSRGPAKYLCVQVDSTECGGKGEHVNIKVPLAIVKAGIKIGSVLPDKVNDKVTSALSEKGIQLDLKSVDGKAVDDIIEALREVSIDVDEPGEKVRIFCK